MYDTVNFWLNRCDAQVDVEEVANRLERAKYETDRETGETLVKGKLSDLRVTASTAGVSIKGSLAKFYFPYNTYTLDRRATQEAVEKLSDTLSLPMGKARVTRIDVSTNFVMRLPVKLYFEMLGDCRYYSRQQATNNTLYYHLRGMDCKRSMCFYDKARETKANGGEMPDVFVDENLLRYECRWKGRLPEQFKQAEITGASLYDRNLYLKTVKMWGDYYFSIKKKNQLKSDAMAEIKTVKDGMDYICAVAFEKLGTDEINRLFEELKANKVYGDPKYYTRLKQRVNALSCNAKVTETSDLIRELDSEVKNVLINA